jgi:hypothetical protein
MKPKKLALQGQPKKVKTVLEDSYRNVFAPPPNVNLAPTRQPSAYRPVRTVTTYGAYEKPV